MKLGPLFEELDMKIPYDLNSNTINKYLKRDSDVWILQNRE